MSGALSSTKKVDKNGRQKGGVATNAFDVQFRFSNITINAAVWALVKSY